MKPIINGLFINLQYAEIPPRDIPILVEKSYRPTLKAILKRQKEKFHFGLTGRSIEILAKNYSDVLKLIQALVKNKQFEMVGNTYSNPPLALLPLSSQKRQIESHLGLVKKYFALRPKGFELPEYVWDPTLSKLFKDFGFSWTVICQHQIDLSKRANIYAAILKNKTGYSAESWTKVAYRSLIRKIFTLPKIYLQYSRELKITDHEPFKILGVNSDIIGIKNIRTWTGFIIAAAGGSILQSKTKLKDLLSFQAETGRGLFFPFAGDLENINFKGNSPLKFTLKDFLAFLDLIQQTGKFVYQHPSEYLKGKQISKELYIKTSSSEPSGSLNMWERDPDSMRIESLCREIREKLDQERSKVVRIKAERLLMLAENGDGRGWNPVPERRIECFRAALEALQILK